MTNRFARSVVLIAIVATTTSAAFAASRTTRHDGLRAYASVQVSQDNGRAPAALPSSQPMSGAEWFQNNGISEALGYPYRGR
jgi:hypothetical protein